MGHGKFALARSGGRPIGIYRHLSAFIGIHTANIGIPRPIEADGDPKDIHNVQEQAIASATAEIGGMTEPKA